MVCYDLFLFYFLKNDLNRIYILYYLLIIFGMIVFVEEINKMMYEFILF